MNSNRVQKIRLKKRQSGFFNFESEIISSEHSGFLVEMGKNIFQLTINPYVGVYRDSDYYVIRDDLIPSDFSVPYQLDAHLVSKESVFREKRNIGVYSKRYFLVEGLSQFEKLPKPHIDEKDFISIISSGWNNADEDYLGISMALLLLSSPNIQTTTGGLGGESYFLSPGHEPNALRMHLEVTLFKNLPYEMTVHNPISSYDFVQNDNAMKSVISKINSKNIREVTYNLVKPMNFFPLVVENRTPTVPLVIREASPYKKTYHEMYGDAVEWIIRARLIKPELSDRVINMSKKMAIEYNDLFENTLGQLGFTFSEINISQTLLSLSRLHLNADIESSLVREYDELLRFTSDNVNDIIKIREGEDRLKINPYLRYPEGFRITYSSLCKLYRNNGAGVDIEEVDADIGVLIDSNKIRKYIDVAYEDGYIYSIDRYKNMKPVI